MSVANSGATIRWPRHSEPLSANSSKMQEDTAASLGDIRDRYPGGLIPQLLEVQKHRITETKWLDWARDPLCLDRVSEKPSRKRRRGADGTQVVNPSKTLSRASRSGRDYVAVSYTSQPSEYESTAVGGYGIMDPNSDLATPSRVRDCVLERVAKYAKHYGVYLIWIDNQCINLNDPDEHEMAMQSMDLVYSFSKYPVGLLTKPIESEESLDLLQRLLLSTFIKTSNDQDFPVLKPSLSAGTALKVVSLLHYITSDNWWTRAWIFQEEYRSSMKMNLLIPHSLVLSKDPARGALCSIQGEIQVNSTNFRKQSTLFCLAFWTAGEESPDGRAKCEEILKRAGKYSVLYKHGDSVGPGFARKPMSPVVFKNIGSREISVTSDLLAIAANCCDYSVRLNTKSLRGTSCSLSTSVLALFLLNGELITNHEDDENSLSNNIFNYLQLLALGNFDPPVETKKLTFIKHCRLVDVRLSIEGIVTSGRLWKLHKKIDTDLFQPEPTPESESSRGLKAYQRTRLRQLSIELEIRGHKDLAVDLQDYLNEDAEDAGDKSYPSKRYKDLMAKIVVEAIENRKTIYLGCLEGKNPYRGVFVTDSALDTPSHVFTAWRWAGSGGKALDDIYSERILDRFVSLQVDVTGDTAEGLPRLQTRKWINGLCFFDGDPARDVVFNYPKSLTG